MTVSAGLDRCQYCDMPIVGRRRGAKFCSKQCKSQYWDQARDKNIKRQANKNWWARQSQDKKLAYEQRRDKNLKRLASRKHSLEGFGLTIDQYDALVLRQDNLCACCGMAETALSNTGDFIKRLAVDHDHKTGQIRSLLCQACNQMIGHAKEDVTRMQKGIEYLKRFQ